MSKPVDKVQLVKQESASGGGDPTDNDDFTVESPLDPTEDAPEVQGVFFQDTSDPNDESVYITRNGDNLIFRDETLLTEVTLSNLAVTSLHSAYLTGRIITASGGAVVINNDAVNNDTLLEITKNPAGSQSGSGFSVTMGANTTGAAVSLSNSGSGPALNIASGQVLAIDGAAGAPGYSNVGNTNTGVYFSADNEVAISTGGTLATYWDSSQKQHAANQIITIAGTGTNPGLAIGSTSNTGLYKGSGNSFIAVAGGNTSAYFYPNQLRHAKGTELLPGLGVNGDLDTGAYWVSSNSYGISTGGSQAVRWDSTQNQINAGVTKGIDGNAGSPSRSFSSDTITGSFLAETSHYAVTTSGIQAVKWDNNQNQINSGWISLPSGGAEDPRLLSGTNDPTVSGVSAPVASIYLRYDVDFADPAAYLKISAGDTNWFVIATTLDQAYGGGRVINVTGEVEFDGQDKNGSSGGSVFRINGGTHTNHDVLGGFYDTIFNFERIVEIESGGLVNDIITGLLLTAATFAAVSTRTISKASTLRITGPPIEGTNITITESLALDVASGDVALANGSLRITKINNNGPDDALFVDMSSTSSGIGLNIDLKSGSTGDGLRVTQSGTGPAIRVIGQAGSVKYTLTDEATITTDCNDGNMFEVTLAGNRTLAAPTDAIPGFTYVWNFIQDGTGGRTITFDDVFKFTVDQGKMVLTTASGNAQDTMSAVCIETNRFHCNYGKDYSL